MVYEISPAKGTQNKNVEGSLVKFFLNTFIRNQL